MTENIDFIDLFGGIGGFRHGLEQASDQFECVDYIEYDKYAVKSYNEIFGEQHEPRDVTQLQNREIADHDLLCAGFPCQSFSVAGNRKGTDEARGKLFREIVRIARAKKPEMLLLENVKGILSQKAVQDGESIPETKGHAFTEVLQALHELGYCLEWQVLNSKHWGVPQNRERVFIIGHLGGEPRSKVFPIRRQNREDSGEDGREIKNVGNVNPSGRGMNGKVYQLDESAVVPTVSSNKGEGHKIINHQFRPEDRPSIENGQSGGSGLLYNSDYSYALSSIPHFVWDDYNSNIREDGNTGALTKNFGVDAVRNGNKIVQIPRGENDGGFHRTYPTVSSNSWHENNFLKQVEPIHTPDFAEKDMNMKSRVGSEDGSMFTVDGTSQHGVLQPVYSPEFVQENQEIEVLYKGESGNVRQGYSQSDTVIGDRGIMTTVQTSSRRQLLDRKNARIRKLTPKECWRLQGFSDSSFEAAQDAGISDTQLYKQAGNAVTVNVIKALGEEIQVYFGGKLTMATECIEEGCDNEAKYEYVQCHNCWIQGGNNK